MYLKGTYSSSVLINAGGVEEHKLQLLMPSARNYPAPWKLILRTKVFCLRGSCGGSSSLLTSHYTNDSWNTPKTKALNAYSLHFLSIVLIKIFLLIYLLPQNSIAVHLTILISRCSYCVAVWFWLEDIAPSVLLGPGFDKFLKHSSTTNNFYNMYHLNYLFFTFQ